jgi:hypothetical protein
MRRRDLLRSAGVVAAAAPLAAIDLTGAAPTPADGVDDLADGAQVRAQWVARLVRLANPVLEHLADGSLKQAMPVEGEPDRRAVTHLEAVGRTLAGLAPWLELPADATTSEGRERARLLSLAREGLRRATDPSSPEALNFTDGSQPLVDAAFLAHAMVRAPRALWADLDAPTRTQLAERLAETRLITPGFSNWLLFAAMVEAALCRAGQPWDAMRVDYALRQHAQWYKGDGVYGDGPEFHWDYYNSFVIHPMLVDVLVTCGDQRSEWSAMRAPALARARRYAAIQERLVAPDGSFPIVGRSMAYRSGAFQALAQVALRRELPGEVPPAQARAALTAVVRRTLDAPGTYDDGGWLRIGIAGHQPGIGERYISTGSLYLCSTAFLPLGLPPGDPFWTGPGLAWTGRRAWGGGAIPIDHTLGGG